MLTVIETHPVQYHAPVYRILQQEFGIPVTAIYGSDFSIGGYTDREFGVAFSWDTDLLSGYTSVFLSRVAEGRVKNYADVTPQGLRSAMASVHTKTFLCLGYSPFFFQSALFQCFRSGKPVLFRAETTDHALSRNPLKQLARDLLLKTIYNRCAKLLYIGEHSRGHYERLGVPFEKLIFSPYCVDATPFETDEPARTKYRAETRARLGIPAGNLVLLFSGKISPRKGPDLLVEAVKTLPQELRERITLVFLGNGELTEEIRVRCGHPPRVDAKFPGFQNQSRLSPFFHAADLFVLPSRWSETWGLVTNEALLHGVPCIVSDGVGCAPDLIVPGKTGSVFRRDSTLELERAIRDALPLIGREEIRIACREKVEHYSPRKAAEGIAKAYEAVRST